MGGTKDLQVVHHPPKIAHTVELGSWQRGYSVQLQKQLLKLSATRTVWIAPR